MLLLEYNDAVYAKFVSYSYYIILAKLEDSYVHVHSPGLSMGGMFYEGLDICIAPKKSKKCNYYLLYGIYDGLCIGLNPNLCNLIYGQILKKSLFLPVPISYTTEVLKDSCRFDYNLNYSTHNVYLEVKSCFFKYGTNCIFPLKKLSMLKNIELPKVTCISSRACKHLKKLIELKGILVFVSQRKDFDKLIINPQEKVLNTYIAKLTTYVVKTYWHEKKLYYDSINKMYT